MAILTRSTIEGSHWYTMDGESCHTMQKADGSGERSVTVTDARRLNLLPSVTNVLGVLHKPQLEQHKIASAIRTALASPKTPEESEEYYIKRIIDASKEDVRAAADLGSRIHEALDLALSNQAYSDDLAIYVKPALELIEKEQLDIHTREEILLNPEEGYAGRVDGLFDFPEGFGVIDFKTRKTKEGRKCDPYDGQGEQLAAYAAAYYKKDVDMAFLYNLYISTTEPGRVELYKHTYAYRLWLQFQAAATIWRGVKNYDPRFKG